MCSESNVIDFHIWLPFLYAEENKNKLIINAIHEAHAVLVLSFETTHQKNIFSTTAANIAQEAVSEIPGTLTVHQDIV